MEPSIPVNGWAPIVKAMEFKYGLMVPSTKDYGATTWLMDKASFSMQTVMFTKVSGNSTEQAASVFTLMSMEPSTKETGRMICKTVKVKKHGSMAQSTKECTRME